MIPLGLIGVTRRVTCAMANGLFCIMQELVFALQPVIAGRNACVPPFQLANFHRDLKPITSRRRTLCRCVDTHLLFLVKYQYFVYITKHLIKNADSDPGWVSGVLFLSVTDHLM